MANPIYGYTPNPYQNNNTQQNNQYMWSDGGWTANPWYRQPQQEQAPTLPGSNLPQYDKVENKFGSGTQNATNVWTGAQYQLPEILNSFRTLANGIANTPVNLGSVKLNSNFRNSNDYNSLLKNGIDYFGQLGISEGLNNIGLQRAAADRALMDSLGRTEGNGSLLSVLKNQNLMRSILGANPLISQAQKETASRISDRLNLDNSTIQAQNQTALSQFQANQQSQLANLQANMAKLQPMQSLIDILSNLQGQARGVTSTENQTGSRNFT